jgi:hypothetical protein
MAQGQAFMDAATSRNAGRSSPLIGREGVLAVNNPPKSWMLIGAFD